MGGSQNAHPIQRPKKSHVPRGTPRNTFAFRGIGEARYGDEIEIDRPRHRVRRIPESSVFSEAPGHAIGGSLTATIQDPSRWRFPAFTLTSSSSSDSSRKAVWRSLLWILPCRILFARLVATIDHAERGAAVEPPHVATNETGNATLGQWLL